MRPARRATGSGDAPRVLRRWQTSSKVKGCARPEESGWLARWQRPDRAPIHKTTCKKPSLLPPREA
eukprot:14774527-Alexandrium_andersonii.AAC.1